MAGHSQVLIIMQGAPGSGKSYLANLIRIGIEAEKGRVFVCPTDDFFHDLRGHYRYDPDKLEDYHKLNQQRVHCILKYGGSALVDNCNIKAWEAKPYVQMGVQLGIPITFIRCAAKFPNLHGVPTETVERMRASMEALSVETCMKAVRPRKLPADLADSVQWYTI
jgi:predicted kinase